MHVCAMHFWPFLHSSSWRQIWLATVKPVPIEHDAPFARAWQIASPLNDDELSSPQQLWPAGQSHE